MTELPDNLVDWFQKISRLTAADFDFIAANSSMVQLPKGAHLLHAGEVQKQLYIVIEGVQMAVAESGRGTHVLAFTYPPGLCAVPGSLNFGEPSGYAIVCLAPTVVRSISVDKMHELLDKSRTFERFVRIYTERVLAGVIARHLELQAQPIEVRFRNFCQRSPQLLQMVPHKYLAAYLNINPTNFSKLFNSVAI